MQKTKNNGTDKRHAVWIGKKHIKLLEEFMSKHFGFYSKRFVAEIVRSMIEYSLSHEKSFIEFLKQKGE